MKQKNLRHPNCVRQKGSQVYNKQTQNFRTNAAHTNPASDRALVRTWICFYGQTDLRKAALKMISKLKWKHIIRKYNHVPVKFTLCVKFLYGLCEKMNEDPGTTPIPTLRQKKKQLVDTFPKDFRLVYDIYGGDFTESFAEIGHIVEDHFDRERK